MIQLNEKYNRADFLDFIINVFLTDFKKDIRPVNTNGLSSIKKVEYLGESKDLDLQVFEFLFEGSSNKRVTLTKDAFSVMKSHATFRTLAIFHSADNQDWRFSLMTATPEPTEKGKVSLSYSNPKRLSFFLGPNAKINTPTKFLLNKGKVINFEDLKNRFSIEVVNKEFYKEISQAFTKLVNGLLKLPSTQDKSQANLEFAVRLIGRVIFCWFLREKKSQVGMALMPKELLSFEAVKKNEDYYHKILEPIFFEILNKTVRSRRDDFAKKPFSSVPYLNGGLFSPQNDDYYKRTNGDLQSQYHNTLVVPDHWFKDFFEILETYNFTIDENTSYDEELSIDPEMLGRIFENLLAEINPETGESARKATGSYYTPRTIVNYMVDESLLLYLKEQTNIEENKLRAIISYDLGDDTEFPIAQEEKEKIINALETLKLLDPVCGSGAFPIGALQKIVFILQQIDPDGQLWFRRQLLRTSPELRRVIEREFEHQNFDYIRKLGIIRENIYGIDIQPIATEIARLRCFLTLIVDERVQDDLENRGIEPLPNLDFKFVTANSLIGLPSSRITNQMGLFEDDQGIIELKELRDMFFTATGAERDQLKLRFVQAQNRMFQRMVEEGRKGYADLTTKLSSWDPFSHKISTWFEQEWMFGIKDGFDIVIANPPYVFSRENLNTEEKNLYKKLYTLTQFKLNLYILFVEKSYTLLNENGIFSFIIPNNWLTLSTTSQLRKFILENTKDTQIVLHYDQIFTSSVDTCVLIFKKSGLEKVTSYSWINEGTVKTSERSPKFYLQNKGFVISNLNSTNDKNFEIILKINNASKELGDLCDVRNGVQAYTVGEGDPIQTTKMKEERVYHSKEKQDESWLKYLDGADVNRYYISWSNQFIKYGYNLSRARVPSLFEGERILVRQIPSKPPYCIVASVITEQAVVDNNCIVIKNKSDILDLKYILALLNSKLISFWFLSTFGKLQRKTFPQFKVKEMRSFPVITSNQKNQLELVNFVDKLLQIVSHVGDKNRIAADPEVTNIQNKIDKLIYELYELTEEEIAIVEDKK